LKPVRNKSAIVGFSYFAGLALVQLVGLVLSVTLSGGLIAGALILGVLRRAQAAALMLLALGIGGLVFTVYDHTQRQPVFDSAGQVLDLVGTVEEKRESAFYTAIYTVKTEIGGVNTRILLYAPDNHAIGVGDTVKAKNCSLNEFRDTGIFPERANNLSRGILLKGNAESVELTERGRRTPLCYIRRYNELVKDRVTAAFPNENGGLITAVFLGDRSRLTAESLFNIQTAGIMHYTAVSGLHMTMLVHMLMLGFGLLPCRNYRKVKLVYLVVIVAALSVFFNLTASVIRASLMLIVFYGGELFMRRGNVLNSMGFALLAILLYSPYAVFDAGLLMSFSGTFGVGVLAPILLKGKRHNPVARAFAGAVCANLCVLPVTAIYFGGISLLAPVVSVLFLPFFTVAVMSIACFAILGGIPQVFLLTAGIAAGCMNGIINFFGQFRFAWISLDYWFVPFWIVLAVIAVAVIRVLYKSDIGAIKAACISVATLALMISLYNFGAVRSERVYISIYSDSVASRVTVRQGVARLVIVTAAHRTAFPQSCGNEILLDSDYGVYDISGRFTLDIRESESLLTVGDFTLLFTSGANDSASPADVIVATGHGFTKREFTTSKVVYVSRSVPVEEEFEFNAYYEPIYLILE
jgi:ComEC/Rec2-related protein